MTRSFGGYDGGNLPFIKARVESTLWPASQGTKVVVTNHLPSGNVRHFLAKFDVEESTEGGRFDFYYLSVDLAARDQADSNK